MLLLQYPDSFSDEDRAEQNRFAGKFQQVTAPVTAKGVEDTAFYIYNRLVSLNEVGGEPEPLRRAVRSRCTATTLKRQAKWPYALSPLSTHDTKRSEDVRARLNVLSEIPDEWWECVARWSGLNEPHRQIVEDIQAPDRERGVPALSNADRRLASRAVHAGSLRGLRQAHSGLYAQGAARSQGPHQLDQPERGVRQRRSGVRRTHPR